MKASGVFGQVAKQVGGIAKSAVRRVLAEPFEVVKTAVGQQNHAGNENQAMEAMEQGANVSAQGGVQSDQGKTNGSRGFKTVQDYQRYQQLSNNKDQLELAMVRKKLSSEWGLEAGIEKARVEYEQKEKQRQEVEEKQAEQKKSFEFEKKKAEDAQVVAAKQSSSAEKRMGIAG